MQSNATHLSGGLFKMIDKIGQNIHAFPVQAQYSFSHGMTLRDYFAAFAMQALINSNASFLPNKFSVQAYQVAEAMLVERERVMTERGETKRGPSSSKEND